MKNRFSDRALILASLILGGCIVEAALIISPVNPLAPTVAPVFKVTFDKESFERQFVAQLKRRMQDLPKADVAAGPRLQSITVDNIILTTHPAYKTRDIKVDYTLTFSPSETYRYTSWLHRSPSGDYLGNAEYGFLKGTEANAVQAAPLRIK